MNNQISHAVARVDVGTPPSGFQKWELAEIYFHGFANLPSDRGEEVESPEFTCLGHRWSLLIYPGGDDEAARGRVSLYLHNKSDESIELDGFTITARNLDGEEVVCRSGSGRGGTFRWEGRGNCGGIFARRSKIMGALVEGTLVVEARMKKVGPPNPSSVEFIPENPLGKNILTKFMDEETADVVFELGNGNDQGEGRSPKKAKTSPTTFYAHRLILQDGAPMLAELCKQPGADMPTIAIAGVKPAVFCHMLYYVYGGEVSHDELEENAKDLIDAADKFGVVSLKLQAEACYVKSTTLSIDNILDNFLYSDSKNCALLKEAVMDFMVENGDDIMGKVSFEDAPGTVATDLLAAMARRKKTGNDTSDDGNLNAMRVGALRKKLHEKGLDVDGSREVMIARLENA